jgi:hypothetical protein
MGVVVEGKIPDSARKLAELQTPHSVLPVNEKSRELMESR